MKHTKIVATIGPASHSKSVLEEMIAAGMNVARLNFSHGTYPQHKALVNTIRLAAAKASHPVALLQDLQGPRIRIGEVPEQGIPLKKGDRVVLVSQKEYSQYGDTGYTALPIQYEQLHQSVKKGGSILIQDGLIDLTIERVVQKKIYCRVVQPGVVFSHKGLNAPGTRIEGDVITKKDKQDLKFGVSQGIDYVALSFVKSAEDVKRLRRLLPKKKQIGIIAKIERAEAVEAFDDILEAADGIMVARGDLGVELGSASVPLLQKEMVTKCLKAAKPVIVATQMLESMTESPRPTRAEAADVANAVIDHADAVMLSAETATGKFPVKAVQTMARIAEEVEQSKFDDLQAEAIDHRTENIERGTAHAAVEMAESVGAAAVVVLSRSGQTTRSVAQLRPQSTRIVALCSNESLEHRLALVWGISTVRIPNPKSKAEFTRTARRVLTKHRLAAKGDTIVTIYNSGRKNSNGTTETFTL